MVEACEAARVEFANHKRRAEMAKWKPKQIARGKATGDGQSYEEMFAKHGRPFGPFEDGRQFPYAG